jgi:hypothetical protein
MRNLKKNLKANFTIKSEIENEKNVLEFLRYSNWMENDYTFEIFENSKKAWEYAYSCKDKLINVNYILNIHSLLFPNLNEKGKIRTSDIKNKNQFIIYISRDFIESELLVKVCNIMNKKTIFKKRALNKARNNFIQISPFNKGNNQVGRILYNIHRLKLGKKIWIPDDPLVSQKK